MKADEYAARIIDLCKEELLTAMPYMDRVLLNLPVVFHDPQSDPEAEIGFGTDGKEIHTFPQIIMETFMSQPERMNRMLFHTLLHCLYSHTIPANDADEKMWNLCTDLFTESMILDLDLPVLEIPGDERRKDILCSLFQGNSFFSVHALQTYFQKHPDIYRRASEQARLFQHDNHDLWYSPARTKTDSERSDPQKFWKESRKYVEQSARSYENARGLRPGTITTRLHLKRRDHDWIKLLRTFIQNTETIHTDPDSFDYVMYTYGLYHYQNMPLIEPLEYTDENHIQNLVIAIDTSASCNGRKIVSFLEQTRSVLESSYFGAEYNVRIIQCDAAVQQETVITSPAQFQDYIRNPLIKGYGGTDYRPVFERINEEQCNGTIQHLQGLIYFTDGNGTYPAYAPSYRTAFVIDPSPYDIPEVPSWAVKIIMNGESI